MLSPKKSGRRAAVRRIGCLILLHCLALVWALSSTVQRAAGASSERGSGKQETHARGIPAGSLVRPICDENCDAWRSAGLAAADEGGVEVATPLGTTYSVHHQLGGDIRGDGTVVCAFIAADPPTGETDDTVVFDGVEEAVRTDINGTVPMVTETVTDNLNSTQTLLIRTRSLSGVPLYPAGIVDPGSGADMTDACLAIGLAPPPYGDPLNWPGMDSVVEATITYFSDLSPVAGPFDVTASFGDPWTGYFATSLAGGAAMAIDSVTLEITVEKTQQGPMAACCDEGACIGDVGQITCEFFEGTWVEGGTCADDPTRPSPVCDQTRCNHDNGQPLFDLGAPASQYAPDVPFAFAAADDFVLTSTGFDPCHLDGIRAWMYHTPATINPVTDYQGITITIYTDDTTPGPRGIPGTDGSHIPSVAGGIAFTQTVPMARVTATAQADSCVSGVWQLDIPVDITLGPGIKYWLELQPILDVGIGRSYWVLSKNINLLPAQGIDAQAALPDWGEISGNVDSCPTGDPPTPDAGTRRDLAFRLFGTGAFGPGNDSCSNAMQVEDGVVSVNNIAATTDGPSDGAACDDASAGGTEILSDVWYEYTTSCDGKLTVNTCGSRIGFDTLIGIYDDCERCPPQSPIVTCNDDSCGFHSEVSVDVQQGSCYRIRVGGYSNSQGIGILSVSCEIPPPPVGACCNTLLGTCRELITEADCSGMNDAWTEGVLCSQLDPLCVPPPPLHDECVNCIPVETGVTFEGTTVTATGGDVSALCNVLDTKDVWHCWTADCTGAVAISLCDSGYDTTLALYDACGGNELACNDDFCGLRSEISTPFQEAMVVEGETYYIRVAGWNGSTGTYALNIRNCANACCSERGLCGHREQAACEAVETNTYHGPNSVCLGDANDNNIDDVCEQEPANWIWADYNDHDPGGYLPDFDQNKDYDNADGDNDPTTGVDSFYGGPTALADLLTWFDRKYPALDIVPYGVGKTDLIESLAVLSGTNGTPEHPSPNGRVGPYAGTYVDDLKAGAEAYLADRGLAGVFTVALSAPAPAFSALHAEMINEAQILLQLGFYRIRSVSPIGGDPITSYVVGWQRVGGTDVAVAGLDPLALVVALSDPDADRAEDKGVDFVRGGDHDHDGDGDPGTSVPFRDKSYDALRHNDIDLASHDVYQAMPATGSDPNERIPGGDWVVADDRDPLAYAASLAPFHQADAGGAFDYQNNSNLSVAFLNDRGYPIPQIGQIYTSAEWSIAITPAPARPCCMPDGSCTLLTPPTCLQDGGAPQAPEDSCSVDFCPVVGDFDADRDVDGLDWEVLQSCVAGPSGVVVIGCEDADLSGDGVIDLKDVLMFFELFTGAS